MNVTLNACNADWRRGEERSGVGEGGDLKSSRIKTNSSFTLVQKRHLAFLFSIFHFLFINKPVITKGEVSIFGDGDFQSSKTTWNIRGWWRRDC